MTIILGEARSRGFILRTCAAHGRNFWCAHTGGGFGGRFFCPGYLRDDLFRDFDPRPRSESMTVGRQGDHTVRLIRDGWPTADSPQCVMERDGNRLLVRPLGMQGVAPRWVAMALCWPNRYVPPSRPTCSS